MATSCRTWQESGRNKRWSPRHRISSYFVGIEEIEMKFTSFTANSVGFRRGARVRGLGGENQALHQRLLEAEIPRGLGR